MLHFSMESVAFPLLLSSSNVKKAHLNKRSLLIYPRKKMQKKYRHHLRVRIFLFNNKLAPKKIADYPRFE